MGISAQQFQQLQDRVSRRAPKPVCETVAQPKNQDSVILGIDPSLRGTGFGVVRRVASNVELVSEGTIKCSAGWSRPQCLAKIAQGLREIIRACQPSVCVIESLFYAQNLQTALIMGEARGACLVAVAEAGLDVYEIAPRKVKQAIVGYGAAQKLAVAKMVQRLLRLPQPPAPDAADALALALSYAQESRSPVARLSRKL